MGNPIIRMDHSAAPAGPMVPHPEAGVLAYMDADAISAALRTCPPAGKGERTPRREVTLLVPGRGQVRFTMELSNYRHKRSTFWHWVAVRADLVQP